MAMQKPTPEEKLFSVIQGAKAVPLRGRGSRASLGALARQTFARIGSIDLPHINQLLMAVIGFLGLCLAGQFLTRPNLDRLMVHAQEPAPFRIAPPLQGLKPLDEYLPKILEQDPFRVGQQPVTQAAASASQSAVDSKPDPKTLIGNMRLVGISWGDAPTAMIEQDKQTYFLKPGDTIGGLSVKDIQKDHVILKSGDQEVDLF